MNLKESGEGKGLCEGSEGGMGRGKCYDCITISKNSKRKKPLKQEIRFIYNV